MTLTKLFSTTLLSVALSVSIVSCSSDSEPGYFPVGPVNLLSVEVSANFDLSARSNWKLYVGSQRYAFEMEGNALLGVPYKESEPFTYDPKGGSVIFTFRSDNYGKGTREAGTGKLPANLEKQDTPNDFLSCDVLRAEYKGDVVSELKDIVFFHQNGLLVFNTIDMPAEATVYILQDYKQQIRPLRDSEDPTQYKAIVLAENALEDLRVKVELNGQTYTKPIFAGTRMPMFPQGVGNSALIEFSIRFTEKGEVLVENAKRTAFVREWPIDR